MNHHLKSLLLALTPIVTLSCTGPAGDEGPAGMGTDGLPGQNGTSSLVSISDEPPGANCSNGGVKIESGTDDDRDGTLDAGEVDATRYVCDGDDGLRSLVRTSAEPKGNNCIHGGQRVETGIDDNDNGTLEAAEIDATSFVCNAAPTLVSTSVEPAGVNCADGGLRVRHGVDDNGNGVLETGEVDGTAFVCHGLTGLVRVTNEPPGAICTGGGVRVDHGLDDDGDGILDNAEIEGTSYVCNGGTMPPPATGDCADILAANPSAPSGAYTVGSPARTIFCDMRGTSPTTYEELAFGRHTATYAGYTELRMVDLQDSVLQQAFITLYNAQSSAVINIDVGYSSSNCCFRTADATGEQSLHFGNSYLYPATTGNVQACNPTGGYTAASYRFQRPNASSEFSPNPMMTDYFTTRPVTNVAICSTGNNPGFFWKRN
jgi:hypothetical protein